MKEIHFFEYTDNRIELNMIHSWNSTEKAINNGNKIINTTQMGLLSTDLIPLGYRLFVHESPSEFYEIVIGGHNTRTKKDLRMAHNLFKMWRANAFRKFEGNQEDVKYLVKFKSENDPLPIRFNGRFIYFDSSDEASKFINDSWFKCILFMMMITEINSSEITEEKYISFEEADKLMNRGKGNGN